MGYGGRDHVNDEQLREIYAGAMTSRARPGHSACPDPEAILALVRREGAEETRLVTLDHVMSCADCREEFDLLRSIQTAGAQAGAAARPGRRWVAPVALAASVLLAVVSDVVRAGPDERLTLLAPPPEVAAGSALLFVWHPIVGTSRYRLEVMNPAGEVVLEAETADTAILIEGAADLEPGNYQWWVGATGPDAARSALRPLRLTASQ